MRRLFFIMAVAAVMAGCSRYDIDEVLLGRNEISFTIKGEPQFVYDPLTSQFSHNKETNVYRMFDDKLSDWVTVQCSERPDTEGQTVIADISWTASSSTRHERNLKFVVHKTSANGEVWMWYKSKNLGIVIKNL